MIEVYRTKKGNVCSALFDVPPPRKKEYLYLLQIGKVKDGRRLVKIGTTKNLRRRMGQLLRIYQEDITMLWVSAPYSHFTTLRVEDEVKNIWREYHGFEYIPNDRFWVPAEIETLTIQVKKEYTIDL